MASVACRRIMITGIVQGVGFRPFVYNLAKKYALAGWVQNTSSGVIIEVEGSTDLLKLFTGALTTEAPPLADIHTLKSEDISTQGYTGFRINDSQTQAGAFQPISPDICTCPDCLVELFDSSDRRYRYPFINCTNCGPRYTIIQDIPYDRPNTTMDTFAMCPDCQKEYHDPSNRRFHAQPVACPTCGPKVWVEASKYLNQSLPLYENDRAVVYTQYALFKGLIGAIKGLGGFHLACDATQTKAVTELRRRKLRVDKPFAVMMPDIETVQQHCHITEEESLLLDSHERPIVLLRRRSHSPIAEAVAPQQDTLGVMLPYTPLHYLLFSQPPEKIASEVGFAADERPVQALVMTSGNWAEEPIATENSEAQERLAKLADFFLMHNRPIHIRCDDSVVRVLTIQQNKEEKPRNLYSLRRSRGYAPYPVGLPWDSQSILAGGGELKNTFCLAQGRYAFLSHHIGDLQNYETLQAFEMGIAHFEKLFHVQPAILAHDLHPDYLSTRYILERAERENLKAIGIQHHHAHIAACMAENKLPAGQAVIGIALDGTGYGDDSCIWGGEILIATMRGYQRARHLEYMPLPGGDAATRKPARIALAYLWKAGVPWEEEFACCRALCAEERTLLRAQLEHQINTPFTSSAGRLFDAVAALAGVRQTVSYEAQAAIELEAAAAPDEKSEYSFPQDGQAAAMPVVSLIQSVAEDVQQHTPVSILSARFHNTVARIVCYHAKSLRQETGIQQVVLSGGVWQNMLLLKRSYQMLTKQGFQVWTHSRVPTNDGGISLGQAVIAHHQDQ